LVSLAGLCDSPFADVVCYPRLSREELCFRLRELEQLEISAVEFVGEKTVHNVRVLGKGCVGIVVKAFTKSGSAVLKIRRTDADRKEMGHEAEMLKMANSVGVGPCFLGLSRDFLLMEFVDGVLFPEWLEKAKRKRVVRSVLRLVLEQCWRLDEAGLDHGELSHAPKHVIIKDDVPYIVDFETASTKRRVANVTAICQYFFIANSIAKQVAEKIGEINQERLKLALRNYKRDKSRENFEAVLKVIGLC
jgi:putative serine/threonine protein kinase